MNDGLREKDFTYQIEGSKKILAEVARSPNSETI